MIKFFIFILFVIAIEAITEIIVNGSIFNRIREIIAFYSSFLGELIHCGYCTSVWVSIPLSILYAKYVFNMTPFVWCDAIILTFVFHRIANLFHELASKWLNRRPIFLTSYHTITNIDKERGNDVKTKHYYY